MSSRQINGQVDWSFVETNMFRSYESLSSDSFDGEEVNLE